METSAALAQVLPVLYLAIVFNVFERSPPAHLTEDEKRRRRGTPLSLGFAWKPGRTQRYRQLMNAQLVAGLMILAGVGEVFALTGGCLPLVWAAFAYLSLVLFSPQLLWAFHMARGDNDANRHQDQAVHFIFLSPGIAAVATGVVVAVG